MKVLVCGAGGCVGSAVAHALRSRGHRVVEGLRGIRESSSPNQLQVDFMTSVMPAEWARRLRELKIDAVVNCVGVLMESKGNTFDRVHALGPIELFRGAVLAGVTRVVQVSALGVGTDLQSLATPYLHSKLRADEALAALPVDSAVLRPSLLYGPGSQSAQLFATLASLPVISLPGGGSQRVQPLHVFELAEAAARWLERRNGSPHEAAHETHELGGPVALGYREMLAAYRVALGLGPALWLPVPMAMMKLSAWAAEALPQKVFSRDTMRMLERGSVPDVNSLPTLLGRSPTPIAQGLAVTKPQPLVDLSVSLSPVVATSMRASLAFMWIYTAVISALLPNVSGVLNLLARCGLTGRWGIAALAASCGLNVALGISILWRPTPRMHALQACAVVGYTVTAAINMPELTIDHCGPLIKNLPVLMAVLVLWLARPVDSASRRGGNADRSASGRNRHQRGGQASVQGIGATATRPSAIFNNAPV